MESYHKQQIPMTYIYCIFVPDEFQTYSEINQVNDLDTIAFTIFYA